MRQLIIILQFALFASLVFSSVLFAESPTTLSQIEASQSQLRSAFLGPDQWDDEGFGAEQIDDQLKLHFQCVLKILNAQTESSLSHAVAQLEQHYGLELSSADRELIRQYLATKRDWQIRTLKRYTDHGRFPRNEGHTEKAVPIFVDNRGTHCAVGYVLVIASGHEPHQSGDNSLANRNASNQNVRVADDDVLRSHDGGELTPRSAKHG